MKVQQRNIIKAIVGEKYLQPGSPVPLTYRNLDITLTSRPLPTIWGCETKWKGKNANRVKEKSIKQIYKHAPCVVVVVFVIRISSNQLTMT